MVVVVGMKKMGRDEWAFYTRGGVADWLTAPRDGRCGSRIRGPRLLGFFGGIPPHSGWARCASRCFGSEQDPALRSRIRPLRREQRERVGSCRECMLFWELACIAIIGGEHLRPYWKIDYGGIRVQHKGMAESGLGFHSNCTQNM